ncbi:hypothetical protein BO71DRAFT_457976 [Aspergillus ellipticus CBS 707.79]|uniref:Uncharacterized protein n=1 Tax=Aspergillus ellipticus CBS 707.79 TaxID=1448320 RepID=A0A319D4J0_9EURO|nr:hypothetical protein BO71DRAFT_457976 [Aspergillus ellipticus CBS 707.79]
MYHTHRATKRHDKIYALLGMSTEDVSIDTWDDMEIAVIKGNGYSLGRVSQVELDNSRPDMQHVDIEFNQTGQLLGLESLTKGHLSLSCSEIPKMSSTRWTLPASAKPIREGDVVCRFDQGLKPCIVRACNNGYFSIIMMTVSSWQSLFGDDVDISDRVNSLTPKPTLLDFILVWDWEETSTINGTAISCIESEINRDYKMALILDEVENYNEATRIIDGYAKMPGSMNASILPYLERYAQLCQDHQIWDQAEQLVSQMIQIRRQTLNLRHPDVLNDVVSLGSIYINQCSPDELGQIYKDGVLDSIKTGSLDASLFCDMMYIDERVFSLLLEYNSDSFLVTETWLESTCRYYGPALIKSLFNVKRSKIVISESVVSSAVANSQHAPEIFKILLDEMGDKILISNKAVDFAARNEEHGEELMRMLLDLRGSELEISDATTQTVVTNSKLGVRVLKMLLDHKGAQLVISEYTVWGAASNRGCGLEVLQLLFDHKGADLPVTIDMVMAATINELTGVEILNLLIEHKRDSFPVCEKTLEMAAYYYNHHFGPERLKLLLQYWRKDIPLPERVFISAKSIYEMGIEAIKILLEWEGPVMIPEDIVRAIRLWRYGAEVARLLRDHKSIEVVPAI